MTRGKQLKHKARLWKMIGLATFIVGAVLLWERVSYNLHDFYTENFDVPTEMIFERYEMSVKQRGLMTSAIEKMQSNEYWTAATDLDQIKELGGPSRQIAEWYKVLCMIALEEKEAAIALLTYYTEQPDFSYKENEAEVLLEMY